MRALQHILRTGIALLLLFGSAGAVVLLQAGCGETPAASPATTSAPAGQEPAQEAFRPVSPDELALERLPATPFVFWAYALVWIVLIGYVFFLWRRVGRVEQELAALTVRLDERRR